LSSCAPVQFLKTTTMKTTHPQNHLRRVAVIED